MVHTKQLIKDGKKIYYLNIGDPAAFDFKTPASFKKAACNAIAQEDNFYSPSEGMPGCVRRLLTRKKINKVNITADDVLVTEGISEGIQMLLGAIVEKATKSFFQVQLIRLTSATQIF
jgi:aspartate/methionine/tyrosine aminotransferase